MPSIKDLKKRIATVKNTQQTTRAMKMVSAAKLRRAQEAILNHRPYALQIQKLLRELSQGKEVNEERSLMSRRPTEGEGKETKKILLVLVTSDRGLCGGFNSNVIKGCYRWLQVHPELASNTQLAFVGRKGYDFFKNKKMNISTYYQEVGGKVSFQKAKKLADSLVERYLNGEFDEVKFIYNEFKNAATQRVRMEKFLPLDSEGGYSNNDDGSDAKENTHPKENEGAASAPTDYIVKPSRQEVLKSLLEKNFSVQAFRILLESQAGEHGARMSAMENATKNAGEMIRKLTLLYNKQRQAGITKELLEIIAGSESQKG